MIYLFIYLIGFIATYKTFKALRTYMKWNEWGDVAWTFTISLLSFIGLVAVLIAVIMSIVDKYKDSNKPPKWL